MATQSEDFKYFVANHDELFNLYPNKNLVIQDKKVVLATDTFEEALRKAMSAGLKLGDFIIQECTEGDRAYTQHFSSRVVFA